ncbi:MAG: aldose 1-epimerase family protein [Eubacteriales bacterium]|jgi:hypothetical protein
MNELEKRMISNPQQLCYARRMMFCDGRAAGMRVIECANGELNFSVTEDKCLDISRLYFRGKNIAFLSKNGFASQGSFDNAFPGGMLYTCGLDSLSQREGHEMHGRIHNIPAENVSIESGERLKITGTIRDTALFGQNLEIQRTIFTEYGKPVLCLHDILTNRGWKPAEFALLYHINFGYPVLTPAVTIEGDFGTPGAYDDWAQSNIDNFRCFDYPSDTDPEQCFFFYERSGCVRVVSPDAGIAIKLHYSRDTLPCLTEWKSPISGDYALGIEPATTHMGKYFTYSTLEVGESREFWIKLEFEELG